MKKISLENEYCLVRTVSSGDKNDFMRIYQEKRERSDDYSGIRGYPRLFHSEEYLERLWQDFLEEKNSVYMIVFRKTDHAHIANCSILGLPKETAGGGNGSESRKSLKSEDNEEGGVEIRMDLSFSALNAGTEKELTAAGAEPEHMEMQIIDAGTEILRLLAGYLREAVPEKKILVRVNSDNQVYQSIMEKAGGILVREEPTPFEENAKDLILELEKNGSEDAAGIIRKILSEREGIHVNIYEIAGSLIC